MISPDLPDPFDATVRSFVIRATRSRIEAGLLAIPSASLAAFPASRSTISVRFDESVTAAGRTFIPGATSAKEARIYGLSEWFRTAAIEPGDLIRISVIESEPPVYWLIREDRYRNLVVGTLIERGEKAPTVSDAEAAVTTLRRFTGRRSKEIIKQEIAGFAGRYEEERRRAKRYGEARLPARPWVRALLGELYEGRCQLCAYTFQMASGRPYYEIHHIAGEHGDDPRNLLLVCSNCHAKLTHGTVANLQFRDGWLIEVTLCGSRVRVKQLTIAKPTTLPPLAILLLLASSFVSRRLYP
jgi:hypothetical protein